ncbi:MAG TPA: hypothetical protein VL263_01320 [Vicinamibacterales bacterium]|nr:hypothetical protein [Vicinamibacterales bacterium]
MNSAPLIHARFVLLLVLVALASGGCELAGDIFKAGMWVGVLAVVVVVGLVLFLVSRMRA